MPKTRSRTVDSEECVFLVMASSGTTGVAIVQITEGRMFKGNLRAVCGDHERPILWNGSSWDCLEKSCKQDYSAIKVGAAVCHESMSESEIADWVSVWMGIDAKRLSVGKKEK